MGIREAFRSFLAARCSQEWKYAARLLLCPIDLWRYYEIATVLESIGNASQVLDIGSPKIVGPLVRATRQPTVICSDLARSALHAPRDRRLPLQCDALHLPMADASLECIYSVSALEHIAGDGDSRAMKEIARSLAPHGVAIITVPLVSHYCERWIQTDPYGKQRRDDQGRIFFSRYYDWPALQSRIIVPSGLRVMRMYAWQERNDGWYARYCNATRRPIAVRSIAIKLLDAWWAMSRLQRVENGPQALVRHGVAAIVFQKENAAGKNSM